VTEQDRVAAELAHDPVGKATGVTGEANYASADVLDDFLSEFY